MRFIRWGGIALAAAAALAALAGRSPAEIHNGGVDCTNWNGTYPMLGSFSKDRSLAPKDHDPIKIHQTACNGVDMEVNLGGQHTTIAARTNDRDNNHTMAIHGHYVRVYANWVDGYGKNWTISLIPDPLRANVRFSQREFLLTSFHTITEQAILHDPNNVVPLATFGGSAGKHAGGEKIRDIVEARTVYAMPVSEKDAGDHVELHHRPGR